MLDDQTSNAGDTVEQPVVVGGLQMLLIENVRDRCAALHQVYTRAVELG